jgi:hypothetical protein
VEIEICIGRWEKPETDDFYRARVIIYMTDKNHLFSCDINGNRSYDMSRDRRWKLSSATSSLTIG